MEAIGWVEGRRSCSGDPPQPLKTLALPVGSPTCLDWGLLVSRGMGEPIKKVGVLVKYGWLAPTNTDKGGWRGEGSVAKSLSYAPQPTSTHGLSSVRPSIGRRSCRGDPPQPFKTLALPIGSPTCLDWGLLVSRRMGEPIKNVGVVVKYGWLAPTNTDKGGWKGEGSVAKSLARAPQPTSTHGLSSVRPSIGRRSCRGDPPQPFKTLVLPIGSPTCQDRGLLVSRGMGEWS
jgi:phage tail sheath gpL-like